MTSPHIIRKQYLHVELQGTEADGLALQRRLSDLCQHWLTPALEKMLDRAAPAQGHLTIERLEIDVGAFTLGNLEHGLTEAVTYSIEKQLRELSIPVESPVQKTETKILQKSEQQSIHETFFHFLNTGSLPWWFSLPAGKNLEQVLLDVWSETQPAATGAGVLHVLASERARKRLVLQFSTAFLQQLLSRLSPAELKLVDDIIERFGDPSLTATEIKMFTQNVWQTAFAGLAAGKAQTSEAIVTQAWQALPETKWQMVVLQERLQRHWPELPLAAPRKKDESAQPDRSRFEAKADSRSNDTQQPGSQDADHCNESRTAQTTDAIDLNEGLYVDCAGIVILHPFLPRFFEGLAIAADDRLLQTERALCLLNYLVTGEEIAPEYALILPKLLCNIPLDAPVDSLVELIAAEREEATALLEVVIGHWDALRNTSVDGLRGTFLVRPGKVSLRDDGDWLLQVEAKSFDILLDQLPWGIGIIKLPWMVKMLWVEWV
jgi:hypothetical protein